MNGQINQLEIPFECYENCKRRILLQKEAHIKLWKCHYGWVAILNYYRWSIQGYTGQCDVFEKAQKVGMRFGYLLHTSQKQPVTIDDTEKLLNDGYEPEKGTFISWASKFNKIFKDADGQEKLPSELWPFYYLEVPSGMGNITRPAYKMCPDRTSLVIVRVDPKSPYNDTQAQWSLLLEQPKGISNMAD